MRSHRTENGKTQRIGPEERYVATFHVWCGKIHQNRYSARYPEPQRLPDPEHWSMIVIEQEVPQRPAADSGGRRNKQKTYNIELSYRRLKAATDRKSDHTEQFEPIEGAIHRDSTYNSRAIHAPDGELPY